MDFTALYGLMAVAVLAVSAVAATDQCQSTKSNLNVRMNRNETGYLAASFQLQQQSTLGSRPQPAISVRAEPSVTVCKGVRTDSLLVTLEGPRSSTLPGYTYFPGVGSYKLHNVRMSWEEAKTACEKEGAHLVIINSKEEAAVLTELMKRYTNLDDWLFAGFSDQAKEGTFITIFGQPLEDTGYTNWSEGQPNDYEGKEDCGSILKSAELNDLQCYARVQFICEQISL